MDETSRAGVQRAMASTGLRRSHRKTEQCGLTEDRDTVATRSIGRSSCAMIFVLALILVFPAALMIRWRQLTRIERWWAVLVCSDALALFLTPTTAATSPMRSIADCALAIGLAVGVCLMLGGVALAGLRSREGQKVRYLAPVFVVGGIPLLAIALISLLWSVLR
jgi:hypothetical protein